MSLSPFFRLENPNFVPMKFATVIITKPINGNTIII